METVNQIDLPSLQVTFPQILCLGFRMLTISAIDNFIAMRNRALLVKSQEERGKDVYLPSRLGGFKDDFKDS